MEDLTSKKIIRLILTGFSLYLFWIIWFLMPDNVPPALAKGCPEGSEMVKEERKDKTLHIYCKCLPGRELVNGKCEISKEKAEENQDVEASVSLIKGEVSFRKKGQADWMPANLNIPLAPGDEVRIGSRSMAQIRFSDGSLVELGPHSIFTLEKSDGKETFSEMLKGIMHLFIRPQRISPFDGSIRGSLEIRTPIATVSVRGTDFVVDLKQDGSGLVTVLEGEVKVTGLGDGKEVVVPASHQLRVSQGGIVQEPIVLDLSRLDRWWEAQP